MKNLINTTPSIRWIIENVSTNSQVNKKKNYYENWHYRSGDYHSIDGTSVYTRIERLLRHYKGRNINEAFSHFCLQVPKYQQHIFFEAIEKEWSNYSYKVNDEGVIVKKKETVRYKPVMFFSDDYEYEIRHKKTGHKQTDFKLFYERSKNKKFTYSIAKYEYNKFWWKRNTGYFAYAEDFERVILKGWSKKFSSKNDPKYIRLMSEKLKKIKAKNKLKKVTEKAKEIWLCKCRLNQAKAFIKQQKEEERQRLIKRGFDPITSFRTDKQTNPDLINNIRGVFALNNK